MSEKNVAEISGKNPMLEPRIEKVVVNVSVGRSGDPLEKAITIIEQLTEQKPCIRTARKTIREFNIRKKEPIACLVTLRKTRASRVLKKTLSALSNQLPKRSFDRSGNFSFGIKEHIDITGMKYSPDLGIIGMDITVVLEKSGYRVKRRRRGKSKIGNRQQLIPSESISFIQNKFGVKII